jgi:hypothetical protein
MIEQALNRNRCWSYTKRAALLLSEWGLAV